MKKFFTFFGILLLFMLIKIHLDDFMLKIIISLLLILKQISKLEL